jgi:tripartite-type tricarboxylate transporter receptor subunit TctC
VAKLNAVIVAALKSPDILQRLDTLGYEPIGGSADQFGVTIKADIAKYARIIQSAGIKAER